MPEYCCQTGKRIDHIHCDRCHQRRAYNATIRMGLKIVEPGWTVPAGYTQDTDGFWKVKPMPRMTTTKPAPMPKVTTKVVVQYEYCGQEFKTIEALRRSMLYDAMERRGLFDGATESRSQNEEIRGYVADVIDAVVEVAEEVKKALSQLETTDELKPCDAKPQD